MTPTFAIHPNPTTFIVNVIHVDPGKQEEAFRLIQNVVHYVAERQPGFQWSNLARSTDGLTVVNIEAIADAGDVDTFFADPIFREMFALLDAVSSSEFNTYTVGDLVLPKSAS
ncbi:MAG: antibiotic biosynthesis monooxygenase [Pseudomonadota bacterium]